MSKTLTTTQATATKTFSAQAIKAEQGRRRNNKTRAKGEKVRPASWVFPALSGAQLKAILAGELVAVEFNSGRKEVVGLRG